MDRNKGWIIIIGMFITLYCVIMFAHCFSMYASYKYVKDIESIE